MRRSPRSRLGLALISRRPYGPPAPVAPLTWPTVSSVSPDLGDTLGGVPITLPVTNTVTGVTIGGTPCTDVVQNGSSVTCKTPAKLVGVYDVVVSGPGGDSPPLVGAFESWSPLVDYAAARVLQADSGVTAATAATRSRAGKVCASFASIARDGAGHVRLPSGRLLIIGGWLTAAWGASPLGDITNEIVYSDDDGETWAVLLADVRTPPTSGAGARFMPGHSTAVFRMAIGGVEYVYWIGADANASGAARDGGVWRALAADLDVGGSAANAWTRIATTAPTNDRSLYSWGVLGGAIYIMGGQITLGDPSTAKNDVYRSTDGGLTWTQLADAPWAGRCASSSTCPVFGGFLWLIGGAKYFGTQAGRTYYNDVWKFDGTTWTQVLANGHGQWTGRHYHNVVVHKSKLWITNGFALVNGNEKNLYSSSDGATWTAASGTMPWQPTHAHCTWPNKDDTALLLTSGIQDSIVWKFVDHVGTLISAIADRGSGAKNVSQASDAKKPVLDVAAFPSSTPGFVLSGGQVLDLASPDRDIAGGVFEIWIVLRSLNTASNGSSSNPSGVIVGAKNASAYNQMGVEGAAVRYSDWTSGIKAATGGAIGDDKPRLIGTTHQNLSAKVFVGTTQAAENATVGFHTTWTGWDNIGAGFGESDYAKDVAIGAVVILKTSAPSSGAFRTKLNKWAKKWGAVT